MRVAALSLRRRHAVLLAIAAFAVPAMTTHQDARAGVIWERHASAVVDPALQGRTGTLHVVVTAATGGVAAAGAAVRAAHGVVRVALPLVDGVAADLPAAGLARVAATPGIKAVTLDREGRFSSFSFDDTTTGSNFVASSGAGQLWTQGLTGLGVGVAVIDTGVSPMPDLQGRIVSGPDLSGEGSLVDSYGHGTVMAGIIAGNGKDSIGNAGGAYTGIAPKATVVSVKTAGRNGVVDVSTVLQAMHFVSAYKDALNIRVLNLAWGVASTQDPAVDPLDYAVERLWQQGIVVVVAAGNNGPNATTITKPGDDPLVLTTGAYDDKQNTSSSDDSVASWSSRGPTAQGLVKPDLVAPGRYIVAQRSYGSNIEASYPKALISPSYIRGSGTSEATAVVSGLAALILQAHPTWTPDQVKAALVSTSVPIAGVAATAQGAGRVNAAAAVAAAPSALSVQRPVATGLGSLEASRGGVHVQTTCPGQTATTVIQGEVDVRCEAWNPAVWTGSAWTGSAWTGSAWAGSAWADAVWTGSAWAGGTWTGSAWAGSAWTGSAWAGSAWAGSNWAGSAWAGSNWAGSAWAGSAWTSAVYDDEFLTAFWGARPPWWRSLPGEVSDPVPGVAKASR